MSELCRNHGTDLPPDACPYCEIERLKAEVCKVRGELATTRAENLALTMKLNTLESKDSTLHFNHKEG